MEEERRGAERRGEERRGEEPHQAFLHTQIATGIGYTETQETERRGRVPGINAEDVSNNGGDVIAAAWSECGTERAEVFPGHAAPPAPNSKSLCAVGTSGIGVYTLTVQGDRETILLLQRGHRHLKHWLRL